MARSIILLLIGAIAGSGAVILTGGTGSPQSPGTAVLSKSAALPESTPQPLGALPSSQPVAGDFSELRLEAYLTAAATTDVVELELAVRRAVAEPPSRLRDVRLEALLSRLAELDPQFALDVARNQYLETKFFVPLFEAWAESDSDGAIRALAGISPGLTQRELALVVLDVIGFSSENVAAVAAGLPASIRTAFEADALVMRANTDPAGALADTLALTAPVLRSRLLEQVASAAVRMDPEGALALSSQIEDLNSREVFRMRALEAWAELDPGSVYSWLETGTGGELAQSSAVISALARGEPERMLALIDRLPLNVRQLAQSLALQALAGQKPDVAMARLATLAVGQERDQLINALGQSLARRDPEQALAWAQGLVPPSSGAIQSVIQGVAMTDPVRAIDLIANHIDSLGAVNAGSVMSTMSLLLQIGGSADADFGQLMDRIVGMNNPSLNSMLPSAMRNWARRDGEAAFNWALVHHELVDVATFRSIAEQVAEADPARAIAMLDQVPATQQAGWVAGIARRVAGVDPQQAIGLVERMRGQPGFGAAYGNVAREIARTDPAIAAEMLSNPRGQLPFNDLAGAASAVAMEWAGQDPDAAAGWVASLEGSPLQPQAMASLVRSWALSDMDRSGQWLLSMPQGSVRDTALRSYLSTAAQSGRFRADMLDAFSDERLAQQGAAAAIEQIGRNDVDEARRLLDIHVTDPNIRTSVEDSLARFGGSGGGNVIITSTGFIVN